MAASRQILKKMACPNCGAPIEQFTPNAQTIICNTCSSYVAVGMGEPDVVGKSKKMPPPPVPINVGDRFKLDDADYFVMGRVRYHGWDEYDRSDTWNWDEWLLGTADGRLLWLSYDENGFTLYKKMRIRAAFDPQNDDSIPVDGERRTRVHERYPAQIVGAEGELTWKAETGETLLMVEGAAFGKRYSVQFNGEEIEIHEGDPVESTAIATAFNNEKWLKQLKNKASSAMLLGVIGLACIVFAALALVGAFAMNSSGEIISQQTTQLTTASPAFTFPVEFDQSGRPAIVSMRTPSTLPANSSVDLEVSVTSPNETKTYLFTKSFWRETGSDSDGPWDESDYSVSDMFVPTEKGSHTLEVLLEDNVAIDGVPVNITVKRNHVFPLWLVLYGIIVGIVGAGLMLFAAKNSTEEKFS